MCHKASNLVILKTKTNGNSAGNNTQIHKTHTPRIATISMTMNPSMITKNRIQKPRILIKVFTINEPSRFSKSKPPEYVSPSLFHGANNVLKRAPIEKKEKTNTKKCL